MFQCTKLLKVIFRILLIGAIILVLLRYIVPRTSLYFRFQIYYQKFGLVLNEHDLVLIKGESKKIYVKSVNKRVTYTSTDFKVAYVNPLGKVTAIRSGLSFIKVKVKGKVLKCRVRVIDLNYSSLRLSVGNHKWLNVRGCVFNESYKSSNTSVVKVSKFGRVTAISKGRASITVTAYGRTMKCYIIVN